MLPEDGGDTPDVYKLSGCCGKPYSTLPASSQRGCSRLMTRAQE